ncbi:hypothetical protein F2Q70_00017630 [Brassica cretica]|uniref:Uncharacterized protein n=1 Tax=Brassica cretica TaxID=69181 RepID=A0A8S9HUC2_BRACR|nr:hypothetical protein F2Q70_00017630 [Brassica cretica]
MFLFDCWPVGRPMLRIVRGCYRGGIRAWFCPCVTQVLFIDFIESKESQKRCFRKPGDDGRDRIFGKGRVSQVEDWVTDQTGIMEMASVRCLVTIGVLRGQDLFLCTVTGQE